MELIGSDEAKAEGGGEAGDEWMTNDEVALWGGDEALGHLPRDGAVGGVGTGNKERRSGGDAWRVTWMKKRRSTICYKNLW